MAIMRWQLAYPGTEIPIVGFIFGESGVEKTAKEFNKEFLGHLPIHQDLRSSADKGDPLTHSDPEHEVSRLFLDIAKKIKLSLN